MISNMDTDLVERTLANPSTPEGEAPEVDPATKKRWTEFRQHIEACRRYRTKLIRNWSVSIDYRRGKPFASQSDDDTVAVNLDWTLTKTKQAALFSQVPQVRINHSPESVAAGPWLAAFERKVNARLREAGIEAAMDEVLPDCINAAGFGVVLVSYEAITEDKQIPDIDLAMLPPQFQMEAMQNGTINGQPVPMTTVPETVDKRYVIQRISPSDFLWPLDFNGSDFNNAPWVGRTGRIPWAEAAKRFKLDPNDKQKFTSEDQTPEDRLSHDWDKERTANDNKVGFDEIFYKEFYYDENSRSFEKIHHMVFLHGKDEAVVDGPWEGQAEDDQTGQIIGALAYPLQTLTLAYVTDEAIPPSDSAIGRSQVNEINKGRTMNARQRERSLPVRWYNVNLVDPSIQHSLLRGTWQHMIPIQGAGDRVLGEIARANMPPENSMFDRIAKQDLMEEWSIGSNQLESGSEVETKGEADHIMSSFQTKIGRERAKVATMFVKVAQVLGGIMCLYEDPQEFGEGFTPLFSRTLQYSTLADATVLLDANQRLERLNKFVNLYGKSGFVNLEPVLKEIATLVGLDANTVIKAPEPAPPAEPNISLRFTGGEDMMNPLLLAFLLKSGQAPDQQLIEQAKQLIQQTVKMMEPPAPPQGPPGMGPGGPPPPGAPVPQPPPPQPGEANPQMSAMPNIVKRSDDPSGQM